MSLFIETDLSGFRKARKISGNCKALKDKDWYWIEIEIDIDKSIFFGQGCSRYYPVRCHIVLKHLTFSPGRYPKWIIWFDQMCILHLSYPKSPFNWISPGVAAFFISRLDIGWCSTCFAHTPVVQCCYPDKQQWFHEYITPLLLFEKAICVCDVE